MLLEVLLRPEAAGFPTDRLLAPSQRAFSTVDARRLGRELGDFNYCPGVFEVERTIRWCAIIYNVPLDGAPLYTAYH